MGAILVLLLSAAAWAGEDPVAYAARRADLGRKFSAQWRHLLKSLPELAEHHRFVESRPRVDLRFPAPGDGFSEHTVAIYEEGLVRVNRRWLAAGGAALEAKGVPYARVPEILAWKALPVLVHELRHGINSVEMRAELGRVCDNFIVEEEAVAYRDQTAALKALLARGKPAFHEALYVDADRVSFSVLRAWDAGPGEFMEDVRARNEGKLSALTSTRAELLEAAASLLDDSRANLAAWRSKDPEARARLLKELGPNAEARSAELVRHNEDCAAIFSDPELYGRWRRFFSERVEAFAEDWDAERGR
ncbi:MAG: hypothetical protein HYZ75_05970 [Elusimicrobia bacterium]|nr:hypothetical protein [Elusimicrobiota bacterium]